MSTDKNGVFKKKPVVNDSQADPKEIGDMEVTSGDPDDDEDFDDDSNDPNFDEDDQDDDDE